MTSSVKRTIAVLATSSTLLMTGCGDNGGTEPPVGPEDSVSTETDGNGDDQGGDDQGDDQGGDDQGGDDQGGDDQGGDDQGGDDQGGDDQNG